MSDESYHRHVHPGGAESVRLLRETEELFRWRIGRNGRPRRRPLNPARYETQRQHNQGTVFGQRFPAQMTMSVGEYLGPMDRRSFIEAGHVTRRHRDLLQVDGRLGDQEMWFYTRRILRDAYHRAVELENAGRTFDDARACAGCEETHNSTFFTRRELAKGPEVRRCNARVADFRVCDHLNLHYHDLLAMVGRAGGRTIECHHPDHNGAGWDLQPWSQRLTHHNNRTWHEIEFTNRVDLRHDGRSARTVDEWLELLAEKDHWVCPHFDLIDLDWGQAFIDKYDECDNGDNSGPAFSDDLEIEAGVSLVSSSCDTCTTIVHVNQIGLGPARVLIERYVEVPSRPNNTFADFQNQLVLDGQPLA